MDMYTHYEQGLEQLLAQMGRDHPRYADALIECLSLIGNMRDKYGHVYPLRTRAGAIAGADGA
jgi:hypothetical protein